MRAALVDEDDFAVGVESVLDHERHLERPGPAGPARQVHDRIALGRRRDGGCAHHEDADTAPVGLGPVLEHGEVATLNTRREVEVGEARDVRLGTRRRLDTTPRRWTRSAGSSIASSRMRPPGTPRRARHNSSLISSCPPRRYMGPFWPNGYRTAGISFRAIGRLTRRATRKRKGARIAITASRPDPCYLDRAVAEGPGIRIGFSIHHPPLRHKQPTCRTSAKNKPAPTCTSCWPR